MVLEQDRGNELVARACLLALKANSFLITVAGHRACAHRAADPDAARNLRPKSSTC